MARMIDADALIRSVCSKCNDVCFDDPCEPSDCALYSAIYNAPTVDAAPVVHGYWHIDDYDSGEPDGYAAFIEVHCSECGYELGAESGQYGWAYGDPFPLKYCPNCGAKMDGERRTDD